MTFQALICVLSILVQYSMYGASQDITFVDLKCSKLENTTLPWNKALTQGWLTESLKIESSLTSIGNIITSTLTGISCRSDVKVLKIETGANSVKYLPAGMKIKFVKLIAMEVINSGLIHLEMEDLKQFGDDLLFLDFSKNSLSALEGDLFHFNPFLKYIRLHDNPLRYINPSFFQSLKKMEHIFYVRLFDSHCIDQHSESPAKHEWDYKKCNDRTARTENVARILARSNFFLLVSPEKYSELREIGQLKNELNELQLKCAELMESIDFLFG